MADSRMQRERKTIRALVRIYCRKNHKVKGLCPDCQMLLDYAMKKLDRCPFQEEKPTCANCHVHCYEPGMRERVRNVMRFSGPKMLFRHPVLAIKHLRNGKKRGKV